MFIGKNTDCIDGDTGKTHFVGDVWKVDGKCIQKKCKKEDEGVSIQSYGLVVSLLLYIVGISQMVRLFSSF